MKSNFKTLGNYIHQVNNRNKNVLTQDLRGLSMTKEFRKSTSNIVGTDLSIYKLIHKNQFACDFMSVIRVHKLPVVLHNEVNPVIVSPAYMVFEVNDENELLPEYLMMWFRRPEFDRYADFRCDSAIRGGFKWEELCEVELPIPSIEKQREIVREYNTIVNRISLNEQLIQKLEETAQAIYKRWFVEEIDLENLPDGWRNGKLSDLCQYSDKRISINQIRPENYISTENMIQNKGGIVHNGKLPNAKNTSGFEIGNILISNIRPYFKKIWLANIEGGCSNDVLCLKANSNIPPLFLYQILEKDAFFDFVMSGSKGTKMPRGDKNWIMDYPSVIPDPELLNKFNKTTLLFQKYVISIKNENISLTKVQELILSKMSKVEETTEKEMI